MHAEDSDDEAMLEVNRKAAADEEDRLERDAFAERMRTKDDKVGLSEMLESAVRLDLHLGRVLVLCRRLASL